MKLFRIICMIIAAFFMGMLVSNIINIATNSQNAADIPNNEFFTEEYDLTLIDENAQYNAIQYDNEHTSDELVHINVYNDRNKSVVNITTEVLAYNWFFEPVPQEGGVGSGSIIDTQGHILTNYHVIEDATRVFVTLWNGTKLEGKVIGVDRENDLAILKIEPRGLVLTAIPIGNSSVLQIGQKTLAIGNPFGLDRTLTVGIVSGLGRPIRSSNNIVIQNMIQTDASINPGNSGGPLLNRKGEMIGVNTIIVSPSRGSVGVGFAVPAETVKRVLPDLIKYGKVQRGWIEWNMRPLFSELVQYANMPVTQGLLITQVQKKGNAAKAGIKGGSRNQAVKYGRTTILLGGDIVVSVNGYSVASIADYLKSLEQTAPSDTVEVEYYRNNKKKTTTITLVERPDDLVID